MKKPTICRYCGGKVILTDSVRIYGKDYGDIYLCTTCNAFVGVHKDSGKPLGTFILLEKFRLGINFNLILRNSR